jgi:multidrug efflux pump subunit AcrB
MSEATAQVNQIQEKLNMPNTIRGSFSGTASAYQDLAGQ